VVCFYRTDEDNRLAGNKSVDLVKLEAKIFFTKDPKRFQIVVTEHKGKNVNRLRTEIHFDDIVKLNVRPPLSNSSPRLFADTSLPFIACSLNRLPNKKMERLMLQ
jgi:hypothetical protein